jgi:hypothetical protein
MPCTVNLRSRVLLFLIFSTISVNAFASPCSKYRMDSHSMIVPGDIVISWSINTKFNTCGFKKDEIQGKRFIVTIENIFEEVQIYDTISSNAYRLNTTKINCPEVVIVKIEEVGSKSGALYENIHIDQHAKRPDLSSSIDTLNYYLLNGYFSNSFPILYDMKRFDIVEEILSQYEILFPDHYPGYMPGEKQFFNSYFDVQSNSLVRIAYLNDVSNFMKIVNDQTKENAKNRKDFVVYGKVSKENKLIEYAVVPNEYKGVFDKASHYLSFDNLGKGDSRIILKIGRDRGSRKYYLLNERALTNPNSSFFIKTFPFRGAIH